MLAGTTTSQEPESRPPTRPLVFKLDVSSVKFSSDVQSICPAKTFEGWVFSRPRGDPTNLGCLPRT